MSTKPRRNLPTPEGRELGQHLARFITVELPKYTERFPNAPEMCKSCAFRNGTQPNGCPGTVMDALKCVVEMEPFLCHEKLDVEGKPYFYCQGWVILVSAGDEEKRPLEMPWPFSNEAGLEERP